MARYRCLKDPLDAYASRALYRRPGSKRADKAFRTQARAREIVRQRLAEYGGGYAVCGDRDVVWHRIRPEELHHRNLHDACQHTLIGVVRHLDGCVPLCPTHHRMARRLALENHPEARDADSLLLRLIDMEEH